MAILIAMKYKIEMIENNVVVDLFFVEVLPQPLYPVGGIVAISRALHITSINSSTWDMIESIQDCAKSYSTLPRSNYYSKTRDAQEIRHTALRSEPCECIAEHFSEK